MTFILVILASILTWFLSYCIFGKSMGRSLYYSYIIYANLAYNFLHFSGISLTFIGFDLAFLVMILDKIIFENQFLKMVFVTDEDLKGEENEDDE